MILILMSILISGCAIKKMTPPIDTYTIKKHTLHTTKTKKQKFTDKILKIALPISTKEIRSNRILYSKNKFDRDTYAYGRWSDTPNKMLQNNFIFTVGQSGLFKAVLLKSSTAKADYILESRILDFYHDFSTKEHSYAVIKVEAHLIDRQSRKVVASKYFTLSKEAPSNNMQGGVIALGRAAETLSKELVAWLNQ